MNANWKLLLFSSFFILALNSLSLLSASVSDTGAGIEVAKLNKTYMFDLDVDFGKLNDYFVRRGVDYDLYFAQTFFVNEKDLYVNIIFVYGKITNYTLQVYTMQGIYQNEYDFERVGTINITKTELEKYNNIIRAHVVYNVITNRTLSYDYAVAIRIYKNNTNYTITSFSNINYLNEFFDSYNIKLKIVPLVDPTNGSLTDLDFNGTIKVENNNGGVKMVLKLLDLVKPNPPHFSNSTLSSIVFAIYSIVYLIFSVQVFLIFIEAIKTIKDTVWPF